MIRFLSARSFTALAAVLVLGACKTTPEPVVVEEKVEIIVPEVVDTCTPISALTRVVIPAETEIYYAITEIDNPPYEPIQRKEKLTREVKPEEVFYVDSEGKEVLDPPSSCPSGRPCRRGPPNKERYPVRY